MILTQTWSLASYLGLERAVSLYHQHTNPGVVAFEERVNRPVCRVGYLAGKKKQFPGEPGGGGAGGPGSGRLRRGAKKSAIFFFERRLHARARADHPEKKKKRHDHPGPR